MDKYVYSGKNKEEALEKALTDLNVSEKEIYVKETEQKGGLFKNKRIDLEIIKKSDVVEELKNFIKNVIKLMGIEANLEVKTREDSVSITVYSDNNKILIGKGGRTIDALSMIAKQYIHNEIGTNFRFILDVGEYKAKHQKNIEYMAKKVAREVAKTKIEAKLDPMNSYERRLVHSILSDNEKVYTESIGEEPNRAVVIKPRD
ncbi:MAG: KH domain-containing protein [Bacilli bacterium]|nr:KH domain-containing protein [Bacilli bacterium]